MDINTASAKNSLEEQHIKSIERLASNQSLNAPKADKEKKLKEACEGFEAVFIQKMWEGMRASLPKEGLLHSKDEQFWQGMYDQELGKSLAKAGGIGLADMMMTQLSRNLHSASEVAATTQSRTPMSIEPAPLVPPKSPEALAAQSKSVNEQIAEARAANAANKAANVANNANNKDANTPATAHNLSGDIYSGEATQPEAPTETKVANAEALKNLTANANGVAGAANGIASTVNGVAGAADGIKASAQNGPPVINPTPPEVLADLNEFATQLGLPLPNTGIAQVALPTEISPIVMQALQEAQASGQQVTQTTYSPRLQPKRTNREPSRFANRVDPNHPVVTGRQRSAEKAQATQAVQTPPITQATQAVQTPPIAQATQAVANPMAKASNIANPGSVVQTPNNPNHPLTPSHPNIITPTMANPLSPQAVQNPSHPMVANPLSPQAVQNPSHPMVAKPMSPQARAVQPVLASPNLQSVTGIEFARKPVQAINTGSSTSNPEISS